jgi:hypothetical protein
VIPEYPSDPPHCSASINSLAGAVSRIALLTTGSIERTASTPASTVFFVPPTSWIVMVRNVSFSVTP